MKKLFKLAAVVMAAAMLLSLCACGNEPAAEKKTITLGTSADYPPFEFHILKDGKDEIVGIDVSMAKAIAAEMGAELVIKDIAFDNLLIELGQGTVDFVIAAIELNDERDAQADFSAPYYTDMPPMIVTMKGNEGSYASLADFSGKTVGAQSGTTKAAIVTDEMAGAMPLLMQSVTELVNSLVNGKCDAIVLDGAVAEKYIASNDKLAAVNISLGEAAEPYRVAVQNGDPNKLLDSINAAIKKAIENGDIATWIEEADALSAQAAE
ncbi:MAG: transporter substrate-binding domain-containing protein [Clostridia bacterium]|nr:transporter substrate-binding domain-containing protein [Clostridia bacterium]